MNRNNKEKLKAVDLFSGCGGMSLGLKQAGFQVIGAIDIDSISVETYRMNHQNVEVWEQDICTVSISSFMKKLGLRKGKLDLLVGCPPCQGFSTIRTLKKGNVTRDARNNLSFEFLRFVKGLKPRAIMMENVPGLMKNKRMKILSDELKQLGYKITVEILDAANYGVPQRRKRLILLGSLNGEVTPAKQALKRKTVAETIKLLPKPGTSGDYCHDVPETHSAKIMKLIKEIPKNGGSRQALDSSYELDCHKRCKGFNDIYGRMSWDNVSPTITGGCVNPSKGRFLHPEQDRAITIREAAMLQSFPRSYKFSLRRGKSSAATMIGNALPPEFIRRHAKSIAATLKIERKKNG